jgi:hypothetical protein
MSGINYAFFEFIQTILNGTAGYKSGRSNVCAIQLGSNLTERRHYCSRTRRRRRNKKKKREQTKRKKS